MELPDCPPGAEGYEDSVTEVPKKPDLDDSTCTKAELEFQEHLNSLKLKLEDGSLRCMVERRGRDVSSNWIYLCYPCAAVCSGESILQMHISGKKHKTKLSLRKVWPASIFETHPYLLREKGVIKTGATEKINQKMAEEVIFHKNSTEFDQKYDKYRDEVCHIQEALDNVKAPLLGIEYLIEHPPEKEHYEPSYLCTLCSKQGYPRTIVNHLTCFWHRSNYVARHFPKADMKIIPHRRNAKFREGVQTIMNRLAQRIDDNYGRLKPVNIDKEEFEKNKEHILQWIFKGFHISEDLGLTFEEVVDEELINSLSLPDSDLKVDKRNPSPPVVPAPTKPQPGNNRASARLRRRQESVESLSDVSDEDMRPSDFHRENDHPTYRDRPVTSRKLYELYQDKQAKSFRTRYAIRNGPEKTDNTQKPPNYDYKMKLIEEKKQLAIEAARKTLAYHEKNPEKHPLYPEEWKKFWNKRYKEIQAEGKDPSKHDFKPEWISFWMGRMKDLHDEELRVNITELYRKMGVSPPELESYDDKISDGGGSGNRRSPNLRSSRSPIRRRSPDPRRRSPDPRRRSPDPKTSPDSKRRSPDIRRRSPNTRNRSPDPRRRSPDLRRRSPDSRRRSPDSRRRSPDPRRRSPDYRGRSPLSGRHSPDLHRHQSPHNRKSPFARRRSPDYRKPSVNYRQSRRSPLPRRRTPEHRSSPVRSRSPLHKSTSGDGDRRADNPLSQHVVHRNISPRSYHAHPTPSMQTVLISDDELNPDDGLSPWNSDNDIDSVGSIKELRSRGGSVASRNSRSRPAPPAIHGMRPIHPVHTACTQDFGPTDNVVATLRLLVALEDYLGSLGPKIVDLLTEALKMEKEKANSSEELLDREAVVALLETAKEKLKGAVQAGLVTGSAAVAVRASIVRVAAALHEADTRHKSSIQSTSEARVEAAPVSVAGVGTVDRAEIAAQMAAALVAEGRTDVSPEELAQLVEAVVGMAEAKKREVQAKKQALQATLSSNSATSKTSSASTALQMLQSAYDDRNGPTQREDTSDAMDGLSDSDLETLLKNFNELSAEEQHSLIAYLKKLEVREPLRVENLRKFVSAAAANAPLLPSAVRSADLEPVAIESDDDDYTVEDVFKSATQKVKENQIQQEMEIVKKSLEETKTAAAESMEVQPDLNVAHKVIQSSAADLLALVQASIQSRSHSTPASAHQAVDVVTSSNQPRSFGDIPEMPMINSECNIMPNPVLAEMTMYLNRQSPNSLQGSALHSPQNRIQFGVVSNNTSETYISNPNIRPPPMADRQNLIINNSQQYMGDSMQSSMSDGRHHFIQDTNRQPLLMPPRMGERQPVMHDNRQPLIPDNRQPLIPDNRQPMIPDNRQPLIPDNRQPLIPDNRQPLIADNRQPLIPDNRQPLIPDNRQPLIPDNRQPLIPDNRQPLIPDNRQPLISDNRQPLIPDNRQPLISDNRQPLIPDNRLPLIPDNRQPLVDRRQPSIVDSRQGLQGDRLTSVANDKQSLMIDNTQSLRQPALGVNHEQNFMADSREQMQSAYDIYSQDYSYNSGGWNNYRNGPVQNNYSQRPDMNQQNYNNYNKILNMNFRGRGRVFTAARGRGRGRN